MKTPEQWASVIRDGLWELGTQEGKAAFLKATIVQIQCATRAGALVQEEIEFLLWCVGYAQGAWDRERQSRGHLPYNPKFDLIRNRLMDMTPADLARPLGVESADLGRGAEPPNADMSGASDASAPRTGSVVPPKL